VHSTKAVTINVSQTAAKYSLQSIHFSECIISERIAKISRYLTEL